MSNDSFFCESCGAEVRAAEGRCPSCGAEFTGVRCPKCGKEGAARLFKNGCPDCGYKPGGSAGKSRRGLPQVPKSSRSAAFYMLLSLVVVLVTLGAAVLYLR